MRDTGAIGGTNLVLRFLLELAMLAALVNWGLATGHAWWLRLVLGLGASLLVLLAWGAFEAPHAGSLTRGD